MRSRLAWLLVSLVAAGSGAMFFSGCEEPKPPPMSLGVSGEEHDVYFPIAATAFHALDKAAVYRAGNITCSSCHPPGPTFEEFTCITCHAATGAAENELDTAHASARGYAKEDASCFACHPRGEATPQGAEGEGEGEVEQFDHNTDAFPLPHGESEGCAECHSDVGGDYSLTLCAQCHLDNDAAIYTKHELLADIFDANRSETGCRECHPTTPVNPAVVPFGNHNVITQGYGINHYDPEHCKDCHMSWLPEPKDWAIDFSQVNCTKNCHGVNEPHGAGCLPGTQGPC